MESRKFKAKKWIVIAVILMVVSMIGANFIQTNGGKVTVKDLRWETTLGHQMSGLLFVPKGAIAESPLPAVVVSHGMYNNREMQDLNFVELSRRGFVVLSMDMFNHGNSENWAESSGGILLGMYEAVKMLDSLAYVDSDKIGITGHSLGGMSSNMAVNLDNQAERQLINSVLLNCADPTYKDGDGNYVNIYGDRNVGVVAAQYDEWFFAQDDGQGGKTAPRDYIKNTNAQSFLHYGQDPVDQEARLANQVYTDDVEGKAAMRVAYTPAIIHPWSHFSARSTEATINFFEQALGAPNPMPGTNQVWQWKVVFNLIGLIGFFIFLVNFAIYMVFTPVFSSLRAQSKMGPVVLAEKKDKGWFWGSLILAAIFATVTYLPILNVTKGNVSTVGLWKQSSPVGVGSWAAACGLFAIISMFVNYKVAKKKGTAINLKERGVTIGLAKLGKTIVLALIVLTVSYGWVFIADYFFKVDFRIWVVALKAFEMDKILVALFPSALLFLTFYVANSVAINAFNFNNISKKEWVNTALLALFNGIPAIILLLIQYISFFITGHLFFSYNMYVVWLFPMVVTLPLTAVISRKVYKETGNPYLPGIINGLLVTLISCINTLTWL